MNRHKAPVVKLHENVERILHAITYVIRYANGQGKEPTQYEIVKTLFLADRAHINNWGRPITYDNYCAMKHGPVPSLSYNLLKQDVRSMRKHRIRALPWVSEQQDKCIKFSQAEDMAFDEVLSPSDIEALENAFATVSSLSFSQIRKLTHEDAAYVDAWDDEADKKSFEMSLGLLFDTPNYDEAERMAEHSQYV